MTGSMGEVDRLLDRAVADAQVPLVTAIVADDTGVVYRGAAGAVDTATGAVPVGTDTPFQIKSMTKAVTCVVAWQFAERGELELDAPVEAYLPEFSELQVLDGFDDSGTPRLRAPASRATIRQLMTSTVGLGYWVWNADLVRFEELTGLPNLGTPRDDLAAFGSPLLADPGTRWEYGIGYDWLGRVIEAVAGTQLGDVVRDGLTEPLGMTATAFELPPAAQAVESPVHVRGDGGWVSIGHAIPARVWQSGGDGLHSTPEDFMRFQRMLLSRGELDGVQVLRPDTVDTLFTPQLGGLTVPDELPAAVPELTDPLLLGDGWSWSHGMLLATTDRPTGRRAGSAGWTGLFNTHFWVDPTARICAAIYTSSLPFVEAGGAAALITGFEHRVCAAL